MEKKPVLHLIEWEIKNYPWEKVCEPFTELVLRASTFKEANIDIAKAMEK